MKESEEEKTLRIETKVGETAVRAFVEKLRERCELHYDHPHRNCDEHNPDECFGEQARAFDLCDYAYELLPKEEEGERNERNVR